MGLDRAGKASEGQETPFDPPEAVRDQIYVRRTHGVLSAASRSSHSHRNGERYTPSTKRRAYDDGDRQVLCFPVARWHVYASLRKADNQRSTLRAPSIHALAKNDTAVGCSISEHRQRMETATKMTYDSDKMIPQLDQGSQPQSIDLIPIFQSNQTVYVTFAQLGAYIAAGVPNPPSLPPYATCRRTTNYAMPTTGLQVPWETVAGTEQGMWDIAQPTRLTVPNDYSYVRCHGGIFWGAAAGQGVYALGLRMNGGNAPDDPFTWGGEPANVSSTRLRCFTSPIIECQAGDYFTLETHCTAIGGNVIQASQHTYFSLELLG